jgi:UDP:flavonoid glycosyltransferase YjiC (YdhE family)
MSTIVIAMLPELGHINATLKLASSLRLRGHQVYYLIGSDYEAYMRAQELNFINFGEPLTHAPNKSSSQLDLMEYLLEARIHGQALNERFKAVVQVFRQQLASLIPKLKPDLFLIDPFVPDIAVIVRDFGLPFAYLNSTLFNPLADTLFYSQPDLARVPELILCAGEFDFPESRRPGKSPRYYVGASVNLQRKEDRFDWEKIDNSKPLIYCSLGSQPHNCVGAKRFFEVIIEAMSELPDRQMIVATGAQFYHDFQHGPANVLVMTHAPQLQILQRAKVMITHGGLNTIKEAILFGTPMIVFPSFGDQPMNAARIAYYGLGLTGDLGTVTVEQARALIERAMQPEFLERALAFQQIFQKMDADEMDVKIVEALLASVAKKTRQTAVATN